MPGYGRMDVYICSTIGMNQDISNGFLWNPKFLKNVIYWDAPFLSTSCIEILCKMLFAKETKTKEQKTPSCTMLDALYAENHLTPVCSQDLFSPFPSPLSTTGRLTLASYKSKARCQEAGFSQLEAMGDIGRRGEKRSQSVSHLTPFALGRVSSSGCSSLVSPLNHDLSSCQAACLFSTFRSWLITPGWLPAKVLAPTGLRHQVSG